MPYREGGAEPRFCTESMTLMFQPQTNVHMCHIMASRNRPMCKGMATSTRFQMTIGFYFVLMVPLTHSVDYTVSNAAPACLLTPITGRVRVRIHWHVQ